MSTHDDERQLQALFDRTATEPEPWVTERVVARAADVPKRRWWTRGLRRLGWVAAPVLAGLLAVVVWRGQGAGEATTAPSDAVATAASKPTRANAKTPTAAPTDAATGAPAVVALSETGWSLLAEPEDELLGVAGAGPGDEVGAEGALLIAALGSTWDPLLDEEGGSLLMPLEEE